MVNSISSNMERVKWQIDRPRQASVYFLRDLRIMGGDGQRKGGTLQRKSFTVLLVSLRLPDTVVQNNHIRSLRSLWALAFWMHARFANLFAPATATRVTCWKREITQHRQKYNDEPYRQGLL